MAKNWFNVSIYYPFIMETLKDYPPSTNKLLKSNYWLADSESESDFRPCRGRRKVS